MKILCETSVQNNVSSTQINRWQKSTLAIGLHPPGGKLNAEPFILLFTNTNKTGTRYKLRQNVERIFARFLNDGKATISFKEPPHNVQIKCDSIQLKGFFQVLKLTMEGKYDQAKLGLGTVATTSIPQSSHPVTKLVITNRGAYPVKGLPRTLKTLEISGIQRARFDSQILFLKNLQILNLMDNCIEQIPKQMGQMSLVEIDFSNNNLGNSMNIKDWEWLIGNPIRKSLVSLNLSGNKLKYFPYYIVRQENLVTLKMDSNEIRQLPFGIRRLKSLKHFSISKNKLQSLPSTISLVHLHDINIWSNDLYLNRLSIGLNRSTTPKMTLLDLAAQTIIKEKIAYTCETIPRFLVDLLEEVPLCRCGRLCSLSSTIKGEPIYDIVPTFLSSVVNSRSISDSCNDGKIHQECIFCSVICASTHVRHKHRRTSFAAVHD